MGEILIPRRTKVEKGYELLADITVGTATTNVDITGLNIGKGDEVVLVSEILHTSAGVCYLYINGNTTTTNYYVQELGANGTGVGGGRVNNNYFTYGSNVNVRSGGEIKIKLTNSGYYVFQSCFTSDIGSSVVSMQNYYTTSTSPLTGITQINIRSQKVNQIGIGSRFQLYRIGGA